MGERKINRPPYKKWWQAVRKDLDAYDYDYEKEIEEDIECYLDEQGYNDSDYPDIETLHDELWIDDSVTGNGSGSYYCSTWKAERCLAHNWNMLLDMVEDTGADLGELVLGGPEVADVYIRCWLLRPAIERVYSDRGWDEDGNE